MIYKLAKTNNFLCGILYVYFDMFICVYIYIFLSFYYYYTIVIYIYKYL